MSTMDSTCSVRSMCSVDTIATITTHVGYHRAVHAIAVHAIAEI